MQEDCVLFTPQIQIRSGQWIQVGIPVTSYDEALIQESSFPLSKRIIGFRVVKTSCLEQKIQRSCCGQ